MWETDEETERKTVLSHQTVATESIIRPGVESPAPLADGCHLAAVLSVSPSNAQKTTPKNMTKKCDSIPRSRGKDFG